LGSSLFNDIEGSTNDGTLGLDCTARSLLGNFLLVYAVSAIVQLIHRAATPANIWNVPYLRNTLLVLSSEEDGPGNTTGVLALEEEGLSLAVLESKDLAITTDVELAL
jgi:hypothetical protein